MKTLPDKYKKHLDRILELVDQRKPIPVNLIRSVKIISIMYLAEDQIRLNRLFSRLDKLPTK